MGQNGAGKSTIFKIITGELEIDEGDVNIKKDLTIAVSRQVIPRNELDLTVREFFQKLFYSVFLKFHHLHHCLPHLFLVLS
jgi:ATPase subunit of ABC transporter with duplicated ATPase domains